MISNAEVAVVGEQKFPPKTTSEELVGRTLEFRSEKLIISEEQEVEAEKEI